MKLSHVILCRYHVRHRFCCKNNLLKIKRKKSKKNFLGVKVGMRNFPTAFALEQVKVCPRPMTNVNVYCGAFLLLSLRRTIWSVLSFPHACDRHDTGLSASLTCCHKIHHLSHKLQFLCTFMQQSGAQNSKKIIELQAIEIVSSRK